MSILNPEFKGDSVELYQPSLGLVAGRVLIGSSRPGHFGEEDEQETEREKIHKKMLTGSTVDFYI